MPAKEIILDFLVALREDLQMAVKDYRLFASEELSLMKDAVRAAWEDLAVEFDTAKTVLSHDEAEVEALKQHGLDGPQLDLKIGFWRKQREGARKLWAEAIRTGARISASLVHKLFDAAQTILGSLSFIPGIESIKEFKDTIESIADASDGAKGSRVGKHFGVYLLAGLGIILVIVGGLVYGPGTFGASLNAPSMYYTFLALGLALLIGALAELRLQSIESKIDDLGEIPR